MIGARSVGGSVMTDVGKTSQDVRVALQVILVSSEKTPF
jgi:hypothetical protein